MQGHRIEGGRIAGAVNEMNLSGSHLTFWKKLVERQGINGFYKSREARTACCFVRKVEPLNRALNGAQAWIVGLRADQSANRQDMGLITAEASKNLLKLSPLFDWSRDQVAEFVSARGVPINSLHARGFVSIGCAPCTRTIEPGEPERAGRWWWEDEAAKECGLHVHDEQQVSMIGAHQ